SYLGLLPHEILAGLDRDQGVSFWRRVLRGRGSGIAVATLDKAVMGFVSFGASRSPLAGHAGEFYALYVMPEAQGCGVGTALMAQAARNPAPLVWIVARRFEAFNSRQARSGARLA
ncbi:MAG: GNAT family N-acetyltransferase, partial [Chloroflexi bacterium]|nr:GNAT family N-acetyltransferase [Chloroflexota bacterium]